jgi:nucleoside phosphorylase
MQKTDGQTLHALFLTALPVEYEAVRIHLHSLQEVEYQGAVYEHGIFATSEGACRVGLIAVGSGNSSAAAEAERAITYFSPDIMMFVGVAGGIKDVQLGDIVVATEVHNYEVGKADAVFFSRPSGGRPTYDLLQRARAEARKIDWLQFLPGTLPRQVPQILLKPLVSGEKVITSTRAATYKLIRTHYEDAVAVEMEGYGVLQAAYTHQQVSTLVIRGISDLLENKDEADKAHTQTLAARHASAFAYQILARLIDQAVQQTFLTPSPVALQKEGETWEMPPLTAFPCQGKAYSTQNSGTFSGLIIQGNSGVQHIYQTVAHALKNKQTEGKEMLQRGQAELLREDYTGAGQSLAEALRLLDGEQFPDEGAQACFLHILALLRGKRPRVVAFQSFKRIEELIASTLALAPAYSHLYAFALIKRDYAWNGFPRLLGEAEMLLAQARNTPLTSLDRKNLDLLRRCQPRLLQEAQLWWK